MRVISAVVIATLASTTFLIGSVGPAAADASASSDSSAQIIDIPAAVRAHPRNVSLIGGSTSGVLYASEQDPTSLSLGDLAGHLQGVDGSNTDVDGTSDRMVGNREVEYAPDAAIGDLQSRVLPSLTWIDTDIPSGWHYLGNTSFGVLVDEPSTGAVEQVPWGGAPPVTVTGLPATGAVTDVGSSDAGGILLGVESSAGSKTETPYYVDDAEHRAVHVNIPWSASLALGASELAWFETVKGSTVIASTARPTIAHPTGAVHLRRAVHGIGSATLLPMGSEVVEFHGNVYGFQDFTAATSAPVYEISYAGSERKLLAWGHDVMADGSNILVVGGSNAVNESIDRINPVTGQKTTVVAIPTVESHVKEVAVDGDTVYTTDDTAETGAVQQHVVSFAGTPASGAARLIATGVSISPTASCGLVGADDCSSISTGDGTTVWDDPGVGESMRTAAGVITRLPDSSDTGSTGDVSENWKVTDQDEEIGTLSNGVVHSFTSVSYPLALDDGTVYLTGAEASAPAADIVARNLATNAETLLTGDTTGCSRFDNLHSAGNWLVMSCVASGSSEAAWRVVDQTGATAPWEFPDDNSQLWVGDGFMARVVDGDELQWAPLAASAASWTSLGTVADDGGAVSVSRDSTPTIAWVDSSRQAHVALVPVTASASGELAKVSAVWNPATAAIDLSWAWAAPNPASFTAAVVGSAAPAQTIDGTLRSLSIPVNSFAPGTQVSLTAAGAPSTWTVTATVPDSTAPTPSLTPLPATTTLTKVNVTASASDNVGVLSVDVRERSGAWDKAMGGWTEPAALQGIDNGTVVSITDVPGSTYCFATRARDASGNVSAWSASDCTNVLLPVTALARTGAWSAIWNSDGPGVLAYSSASTTAHLTTTTRGHDVSLLVYIGPNEGTLAVAWKGTRFTLNLASSNAGYELVGIDMPASTTAISISPATSGKPITVEGIVETAY